MDNLKELENKKEYNYQQALINDEKRRMAQVNTFEYKTMENLFFSALAYFVLFILTSILYKILGPIVITSALPGIALPATLIGCSLAIGTLSKNLLHKKYNLKNRLKSFSKATNNKEILEEEIYYQIESEKAMNRVKALDYTINNLKKISLNEDELKNNDNISFILDEEYDTLDILTTKKVLHNNFWKTRDKSEKIMNTFRNSIIIGIIAFIFANIPSTLFGALFTNLLIPISPLIIGTTAGFVYMLKRNNTYKKMFNKFNSTLNEYALKEDLNSKTQDALSEKELLNHLIATQIKKISFLEAKKQELNNNSNIFENKEEKVNAKSNKLEERTIEFDKQPEEKNKVKIKKRTN